jgi:hypothetical protein
MSFLKITTKGTSVYYVDKAAQKFMRVKGENAASIDDSTAPRWVSYCNEDLKIETGHGVLFILDEDPEHTWQKTTAVISVTEIETAEVPLV